MNRIPRGGAPPKRVDTSRLSKPGDAAGLSHAQIELLVRTSRASQGLGRVVDDRTAIEKLAALLRPEPERVCEPAA